MSKHNPPSGLSSITRTIFCRYSGVVLGQLEVKILEGHMPYLEAHEDAIYLHPFYRMSAQVLMKKLEDCLHQAQEIGWVQTDKEKERLQLLTSAIMHALCCIKQDTACLPKYEYAVASAGRLLGLAKWFFFISSQRLEFPTYSISKRNENLDWNNFRYWLDSAYEIRDEWSKNSRRLELDAQKRATELSLIEIRSESYRRVDTRKVWNWIQLQLAGNLAPGRIETFKNLFLDGDLEAHEWTVDDVEDLKIALVQHCDIGNEIMHFINKRLDGIRGLIQDFYTGFTLLTKTGAKYEEEEKTAEEVAFLGEFDKKAAALETLPPQPQRKDFTTLGLFLKAEAQWRILKKRFDALQQSTEVKE